MKWFVYSIIFVTFAQSTAFAHTQVGVVSGSGPSACAKAEKLASEKAAVHCYNTNGGRVSDKIVSSCTQYGPFLFDDSRAVRIDYICR